LKIAVFLKQMVIFTFSGENGFTSPKKIGTPRLF
jgi:hypothetical protein